MTAYKIMIEGLDRLGKDTLIRGILNEQGFHQVLHYSKPEILDAYCFPNRDEGDLSLARRMYQQASFTTMFQLANAQGAAVIFNRAHLGECVYAPMYRGYSGDYVFNLESLFSVDKIEDLRLILLTEDFASAKHFIDDGESFDITKRAQEQELFIAAFNRSIIRDKRIICVTDTATGGFRRREDILADAIYEHTN